jgi:hypothetical protein
LESIGTGGDVINSTSIYRPNDPDIPERVYATAGYDSTIRIYSYDDTYGWGSEETIDLSYIGETILDTAWYDNRIIAGYQGDTSEPQEDRETVRLFFTEYADWDFDRTLASDQTTSARAVAFSPDAGLAESGRGYYTNFNEIYVVTVPEGGEALVYQNGNWVATPALVYQNGATTDVTSISYYDGSGWVEL